MNMGAAMSADTDYRQMSVQKKVKKPGIVKRWLLKALGDSLKYEEQQKQESEMASIKLARLDKISIPNSVSTSIDQSERTLNFTVHIANGGRIVETRRYDRKSDRNTNGLYIITNEQNFGHEIDKIITMEALK